MAKKNLSEMTLQELLKHRDLTVKGHLQVHNNSIDFLRERIQVSKEALEKVEKLRDETLEEVREVEHMILFREKQEEGRKWREEKPEEFADWFLELKRKNGTV